MPTIMAVRAPMPPTTPPTIAPIGVLLFFGLLFELSLWLKPGAELAREVTLFDAMLEAEVKDTVTG